MRLLMIHASRVFKLGLLFVVVLLLASYFLTLRWTKGNFAQDDLDKQGIVLRAEVSSLESFFKAYGGAVAIRAKGSDISVAGSANVQKSMKAFVEQWRSGGLIGGIALTDDDGKVILNYNVLGTVDTGVSLADRDYFLWAKNHPEQREFFVGDPVIGRGVATERKYIVPIAASVYRGDVFLGVLVASVKLEPLMAQYLEVLKVSDDTHVHLTDGDGKILFDKFRPELVGEDFFGSHAGFDHEIIRATIEEADEGTRRIEVLNTETGKHEEQLVSYSPVNLENQKWYMVMHTPRGETTDIVVPVYIRFLVMASLFILTFILFGFVGTKVVGARRRS